MDISILNLEESILNDDDSFLFSKSSEMKDADEEVSQILKRWRITNQPVKKDNVSSNHNETFDSRTYTRPKRRISNNVDAEKELPSIESGIASINFPGSSLMHRNWMTDNSTNGVSMTHGEISAIQNISPPSSICTSMDFQNSDSHMLNSLITSGDFTNVSFLLNGNDALVDEPRNATITINNVTPTQNFTRNLMDFTFNVPNAIPTNTTFTADVESPLKEFGVENVELELSGSTENLDKNLTYDAKNGENFNQTIVQSTPIHNQEIFDRTFDHKMSPITSLRPEDEDEVIIRSMKSRNLVNDITIEDYRNSMEDQCEFLLNEETIKLGEKLGVCNLTFECLDLKTALIQSDDAGEKFDEMLDSFSVKKSLESEKLLQSIDTIKQRHSLINFEKQREEKLKSQVNDNKTQSNERLLRRSRLDDDFNIQIQKQQIENAQTEPVVEPVPNPELENNRDRFKTIKLNKRLQSGMVVVDSEPQQETESTSPGTNKERRNQINQQKQEDVEFKKPVASGISKLSKFGFSRPTYRSRNDLNLPLKANSTDSLDEDQPVKNAAKSPMGVKSKSIHNLIMGGNNGRTAGMGSYSNLRLNPNAARSQSNLKAPRASSLVRPFNEVKEITVALKNTQPSKLRVRPSSGYYGNTFSSKRTDSDESSLPSSSGSSRNSVHLSSVEQPIRYQNEDLNQVPKKTGAIPKPSGLRAPSNLRAPQIRSGLPRPSAMPIRK